MLSNLEKASDFGDQNDELTIENIGLKIIFCSRFQDVYITHVHIHTLMSYVFLNSILQYF